MENNELYHHGVKGMKWGVINEDDKKMLPPGYKPEHNGPKLSETDVKLLIERLKNYDKVKMETDIQKQKNVLDYKQAIKLGQMKLNETKIKNMTDFRINKMEKDTEEYKTRTRGRIALLGILAASSISGRLINNLGSGKKTVINGNVTNNKTINNTNNSSRVDNSNYTRTVSNAISGNAKIKIKKSKLYNSDEYSESIIATVNDILCHANGKIPFDENEHPRDPKTGQFIPAGDRLAIQKEVEKRYNKQKEIIEKTSKMTPEQKTEWDKLEKEAINEWYYKEQMKAVSDAQKQMKQMMKDKDAATVDVLRTATNIPKELTNIIPNVPGKTVHPDYSDIPTDELKRRTDRLIVESNYAKAAGETKYIKSGQEKVREAFQTTASLLSVAALLASIYGTVRSAKYGYNNKGDK